MVVVVLSIGTASEKVYFVIHGIQVNCFSKPHEPPPLPHGPAPGTGTREKMEALLSKREPLPVSLESV